MFCFCSEKKKVQEVPESLLKKRKQNEEQKARRAKAALLQKQVSEMNALSIETKR